MDFFTASDPFVRFAWLSGTASFVASAFVVLHVLVLRHRRARHEQAQQGFDALWQQLIVAWTLGQDATVPALADRDLRHFLHLWNEAQESLRGRPRERLNRLAARLDIGPRARELLRSDSLRDQLWATLTLGHLRHVAALDDLLRLAERPNAWLSFAAARALMEMDPKVAAARLMPLFVRREEWSRSRALSVLRDAGVDAVSAPLAQVLSRVEERFLPRGLAFISAARRDAIRAAVLPRLKRLRQPEAIAAVVRHALDVRDRPRLHALVRHPAWIVRVQVARTLGSASEAEDLAILVRLLDDPEWWVRYRAAEALAALPMAARLALPEMLDRMRVRSRGREMLSQVCNRALPSPEDPA